MEEQKEQEIEISINQNAQDFENEVYLNINLPSRLASHFCKEHKEAMRHYTLEQQIELTEHLLLMVDEIEAYAQKPEDNAIYKGYASRADTLLKKYRKLFAPFNHMKFHEYFDFDDVLVGKGIVSGEEYNSMEQQMLTVSQVQTFVVQCRNGLYHYRKLIFLISEPTPEANPIHLPQIPMEGIGNGIIDNESLLKNDKDVTQARQLLAIYYLLKVGFNIVPRENNPVSEIARLAHLLTGTKMKSMNESELYKKLLKMPAFKKGAALVKDLLFIRSYFEISGMEKILQQVNADLKEAIDALIPFERQQFKDCL